jgi:hypothetical protein
MVNPSFIPSAFTAGLVLTVLTAAAAAATQSGAASTPPATEGISSGTFWYLYENV